MPRTGIRRLHARLAELARSPLASRTAMATGFQLLRLVLQVGFLILLARALAPEHYGVFVGAAGLATALAGLSGLGTGMLMVKQVASRRSLWNATWSHAVRMFLSTGFLLSLGFVFSVPWLLHVSLSIQALACIAVSELVCLPVVYLGGFAFQAFDRIAWSAALPCVMSGARLLGVTVFLSVDPIRTLTEYVLYHAAASSIAAAFSVILVKAMLRPTSTGKSPPKGTTAEALRFCAGWFTNNALVEMDKSLAVRFGSPETAAAYALAYRLASSLSTPTTSLVLSAQPRLFAAEGVRRQRLSRSIILVASASSIAACAAMVSLAPALPWLFGTAYSQARHFAVIMGLLPLAFRSSLCLGRVAGRRRPSWITRNTRRIRMCRHGNSGCFAHTEIRCRWHGGHGHGGRGGVVLAAGIALATIRRRPTTPSPSNPSSPQE